MYTVVDFETTGLDRHTCQVIQIGAVKMDSNFNEVAQLKLNVKLRPGTVLPKHITELTGITEADLENGVTELRAHQMLDNFIDTDIVVAHFASFDLGFMPMGDFYDFICTKSVFNLMHSQERASLTNVVDFYDLPHLEHHSALDDCIMTAQVLYMMQQELEGKCLDVKDYMNVMTVQPDRPLKFKPGKAKIKEY